MAIRGIQAETAQQGAAHKSIAHELQHLVADPFERWAGGYSVRRGDYHTFTCPSTHSLSQERLQANKSSLVGGYIKNYERAQAEVRAFPIAYSGVLLKFSGAGHQTQGYVFFKDSQGRRG